MVWFSPVCFLSPISHGTPSIHYNLLITLAVLKHYAYLVSTLFLSPGVLLVPLPRPSQGLLILSLCLFKVGAPQGFILCPSVLLTYCSSMILTTPVILLSSSMLMIPQSLFVKLYVSLKFSTQILTGTQTTIHFDIGRYCRLSDAFIRRVSPFTFA